MQSNYSKKGELVGEPSFDLFLDNSKAVGRNFEEEFNVNFGEKKQFVLQTSVGNYITNRPRREIKLSGILKSPFAVRPVNVNKPKLSDEESAIYNWIEDNAEDRDIIVFKWNGVYCTLEQMQTLSRHDLVMVNVIDTWTCILNDQEKSRSPESPYRMFCTVEATKGTLNNIFSKTRPQKEEEFVCNMELLCAKYKVDTRRLDMIFFPIYEAPHYYVICFNLKLMRMEILDNIQYIHGGTAPYVVNPPYLRDNLVYFLRKIRHHKARGVQQFSTVRVSMPWQITLNDWDDWDSGVFVMRHLETYMRTPVKLWKTDLDAEGSKQDGVLARLRALYCYRMLTSTKNLKRKYVIENM